MKNFVYKSDYSKASQERNCKHPHFKKFMLKQKLTLHSLAMPGLQKKLKVFKNVMFDFDCYAQKSEMRIEAVIDYKNSNARISVLGQYLEFYSSDDSDKLNYAIKNADKVYIFNPQVDDIVLLEDPSPDEDIGLNIIINYA